MHEYDHIHQKKKSNSPFTANCNAKLLHYLLFLIYFQIDIIIVYIVSATTSQYFSKFHSLFNREKEYAEKM